MQPVLLCTINNDVCWEIDNLKNTKNPFSITASGTCDTIYDELLSINVSIQQRPLHFPVTEVFKSPNNLNP